MHKNLARLFNEWMRRFIDEPEKFARDFETVQLYLAQASKGEPTTYGDACTAYLNVLAAELGIAL